MTTVHVGLPTLQGDVGKFAEKFDLLEVRPVDSPMPRVAKLRQWRKDVPPAFVFSVVIPSVVSALQPSPQIEEALAKALEAAEALQARCMVITTPVSVTPTTLYRKRLKELVDRLPRDVVMIGWEPRGIWSVAEAAELARDLGITLIVDAAQDDPPRGAAMYTRLRGIGTQSRLGPSALNKIRAAMAGRREVFVVVETDAPRKVAAALKAPLDGPARAGAGGVIRPQVRLSAEDEEQ
jgi:uncharacterized protein YecE (DUF72 family)